MKDGKYGMICEVGNVDEMSTKMIQTLSLSEEDKKAKIAQGHERANDFAAKNIVKQYENVFLEAINTGKEATIGDDN